MTGLSPMRLLRRYFVQNPQLWRVWLRPLLIIGLLLLSTALPFMSSQRQLMLVLSLPVGVGLVLTFLRWPSLGLIVAALAGMVVPFLGPSGINATVLLVACLSLCFRLVRSYWRPTRCMTWAG